MICSTWNDERSSWEVVDGQWVTAMKPRKRITGSSEPEFVRVWSGGGPLPRRPVEPPKSRVPEPLPPDTPRSNLDVPPGRPRLPRAKNPCTRCGIRPKPPGKRMCEKCRETARRRVQERRAEALAEGRCGRCFKHQLPEDGRGKICEYCSRGIADAYAKRLAKGVCATCGKRPRMEDITLCSDCHRTIRERDRVRDRASRRPTIPFNRVSSGSRGRRGSP